MDITEKAAQKLKDNLLQRFLKTGVGFRIAKNDSKTEQTIIDIKMDHEQPGDKIIDSYGIKIFMDPVTASTLEDCELDLDKPDTLCVKRQKEVDSSNQ
jgi:Fe-S cluster assembly iron-binding protein IscA